MEYLVLVAIILAVAHIGWFLENYRWNKGICRETGEPWKYFDTDSHGGRGYKSGEYVCWISWPFIDSRASKQ